MGRKPPLRVNVPLLRQCELESHGEARPLITAKENTE
jgi:hypothetical protein